MGARKHKHRKQTHHEDDQHADDERTPAEMEDDEEEGAEHMSEADADKDEEAAEASGKGKGRAAKAARPRVNGSVVGFTRYTTGTQLIIDKGQNKGLAAGDFGYLKTKNGLPLAFFHLTLVTKRESRTWVPVGLSKYSKLAGSYAKVVINP
jgi:hypothetical protein